MGRYSGGVGNAASESSELASSLLRDRKCVEVSGGGKLQLENRVADGWAWLPDATDLRVNGRSTPT